MLVLDIKVAIVAGASRVIWIYIKTIAPHIATTKLGGLVQTSELVM